MTRLEELSSSRSITWPTESGVSRSRPESEGGDDRGLAQERALPFSLNTRSREVAIG